MKEIPAGSWVLVHSIILEPEQRAPQVPVDTKKVPLEMWVKGYLEKAALPGDSVTVKTCTGRMVTGKLVEANPTYNHSFGFVPELQRIGGELRAMLAESAGAGKGSKSDG
ncbi:MAG TPA: 2-amino-4-ketopentanoate thiolase [Firmicutes bacterium]|jgi:hypothetical protein|nr:2-amino-4-ketopentanoate thiolase [Bacillota bacterium]HBR24196.1 2-amino-4-ketopentanoate thiolase [Bacillota bacterium]HCT37489.1 2-amino-4-ketopentanoate thiolase [Bacillota bacterium]